MDVCRYIKRNKIRNRNMWDKVGMISVMYKDGYWAMTEPEFLPRMFIL